MQNVEVGFTEGLAFAQRFIGGTLVEYLDGAQLEIEWGRATIISVSENDGMVTLVTDAPAHLDTRDFGNIKIVEHEGVCYLRMRHMPCYALAPKGVRIPLPNERKAPLFI